MPRNVLVVGEALLDIDLHGNVGRVAPDAPVPVVDDITELPRPGGAALAAAMAAEHGAQVVLATPLASDDDGARLRELLEPTVTLIGLPQTGATPTKRRVRAGGQTIVRLDSGGESAPWVSVPERLAETMDRADVVLVSDYGRGLTCEPLLRRLLQRVARTTPVVWDPHPRGADPVLGVHVYTPNLAELRARATAADGRPGGSSASLDQVATDAAELARDLGVRAVATTLGDAGALLLQGDGAPLVFGTTAVEHGDPCGAGDRFASTVAVCLADDALVSEAIQHAVEAATEHVRSGGAASFAHRLRQGSHSRPAASIPPSASAVELARRVRDEDGTVVATGGCFDLLHAGHIACLEAAARLGDCLIVCLNSDDSVRRLKGPSRPLMPAADRVRVLESLACVDAVLVFDEDTPADALRALRPHLWTKGGDYSELPEEAVLSEWGGRALILPYLEGRSTSGLVDAMTTRRVDPRLSPHWAPDDVPTNQGVT